MAPSSSADAGARPALPPAPAAFLDRQTGAPAFGAYAGPLPAVDLGGRGVFARVARRKRWVYVAVSASGVWIAFAVVRTGYAATAFAFAYDLRARRMLLDGGTMGPALAARVADDPHRPGSLARFRLGRRVVAIDTSAAGAWSLHVRLGELELDAELDPAGAAPALSVIADLGAGLVDATEKRALFNVRGRARCAGREISLDGGVGGYDYTHGLLPRHTRWRWAFGMGAAEDGAPLGFNLAEGFVGGAECAAFHDGRVVPLGEPRFELDAAAPEMPWRLCGPDVDLRFEPGAVHAQHTRLVVVRSRFVQPVGTFHGSVRVDGKELRLAGLPGVVEDQDVLW